jgi:type II restriction enzyme
LSKRNFSDWLGHFRKSINEYEYYVNFPKVFKNVDDIKVELNILNSLIGSHHIEEDFRSLLNKYPEILKCIPILLAVREHEIYAQDDNGAFVYNFKKPNYSVDQYVYFMDKTGLFDLISHHIINNLVDYVMGVETGLDSNGRKNRGGHQMENLVERMIKRTGAEYYKEMYLSEIEEKWHVDLSTISAQGTTEKRFDYVVKTPSTIFLIETNFYTSGGSKLNEVARSYKMIAEETSKLSGIAFVWLTDGKGWKSARHNLEETFDVMDYIFNIDDMEHGVLNELFKN